LSPKWLYPFRFPNHNFVRISHLFFYSACPTNPIFLDLITIINSRQ
jgi:hypothetical protein